MRTRLGFLTCLLVAYAASAQAQTGTGRITGTVKDVTGAIVPGVRVIAVQEETGVAHETTT
jgi:hypothetical protein